MSAEEHVRQKSAAEGHESDFASGHKSAKSLAFSPEGLGQLNPQHCPHPKQLLDRPDSPLGEPMTIREVSNLIGCSLWTVRQRCLPQGLPHFRIGSNGKLIFYRQQVIRWILERQKKGGRP